MTIMHLCSVAQSCLTLCNPMDYSLPDSFVHGTSQARILEWVAISSSRGTVTISQGQIQNKIANLEKRKLNMRDIKNLVFGNL